jgi:hypothetical protein
MYRIIGADGREYGPVTAEQLRQWMQEGRVNAQTQGQAEGSPEWKPLAAYPELAPAAPASPAPAPQVSAPAGEGQPSIEEIDSRDYEIGIGDCITRGWELVKANFGILVGGTVLVFVLQGVIQTPGSIGRMLVQIGGRMHQPVMLIAGGLLAVVGAVLGMVLAGPITGGLYWPYLRLLRGQPAEIGDFFAGFRRGFVNLMLLQIVMGLIMAACIVPGITPLVVGLVLYFGKHMPGALAIAIVGGALLLVAIVVMIYLSVCWFYALPLAVDRRLGFWEAMKLSKRKVSEHWWQVFGLTFVAGLVGSAGLLLCCVGILFTMPIALASFMCGYEVIFGRRST